MSELICTKCGAPLQNNSFYCSKCGARVNHPVKIEDSEKTLAKRAKDEAKREENRIKRQTPAYKKMQKIVGITVPCSVIVVTLLLVFLLAPIQASAMGYVISLDNSGGIEIDIYNNKTENLEIPEEMWYLGAMRPVTSIGSQAFGYCYRLTSITIPDSVTTIGSEAFYRCDSLTDVYYEGDIAGWCGISFRYSAANPMYCADNLYIDGKLIEGELVIPDEVTSIPACAFRGQVITRVTIPDSVTTIGDATFLACDSLTSVTIGDSVTTIGSGAFNYCNSLTSIVIPDSVTTIDEFAFRFCDSLTDVYFTGTKRQWEAIAISYGNEALENATIHYNYVSEQN